MEYEVNHNLTMGGDTAALFTALAKAQGEMGAAKKSAANPHFKSKFADLATVLDAILPALNKHGLALVQMPGKADGNVTLTTMITHSSGGWLMSKAATDMGRGSGPQAVGSAITYLRRYCAQAALALPAEDDDGERAEGRDPYQRAPRGGDFKKAFEKPTPYHPSWKKEHKAFLAAAGEHIQPRDGQSMLEAVCEKAKQLGFEKRPPDMDSGERDMLLVELSGEVF